MCLSGRPVAGGAPWGGTRTILGCTGYQVLLESPSLLALRFRRILLAARRSTPVARASGRSRP